jgi:hypothetical protein
MMEWYCRAVWIRSPDLNKAWTAQVEDAEGVMLYYETGSLGRRRHQP